jgi:hypothetical protein
MTRECKVSRKSPRQCRERYCYQKFSFINELLPAVLTLREELYGDLSPQLTRET